MTNTSKEVKELVDKILKQYKKRFFIETDDGLIPNPSPDMYAFSVRFLREKITQLLNQISKGKV